MEQEPLESQEEDKSAEKAEEPNELTREELVAKLRSVLAPEHIDYLLEAIEQGDDLQDMIGHAYGALLEQGEDPDEVLAELGITEQEGS